MDKFELNFAFMDGDLALCEELRQKGCALEFSHNDVREALLSGNLELILWLRNWYEEHWVFFCERYYPFPNAVMGGNVALAQMVWDFSLEHPRLDVLELGSSGVLDYALQSNNPEMVVWVEQKYPNEKVTQRHLMNAMSQDSEEVIVWVLRNRKVETDEDLLCCAIECMCEKVTLELKGLASSEY
nr:ankyrin repeat containing protein [Marseillevirus futianmevirus]